MPHTLTLDQHRAVAAALPDPVFILTASGRYASITGGADKRYYHDGSALLGKYLHEVLSAERTQWFIGQIQDTLRTQRMLVVEYELSNKDVLGLLDEGPTEPIWFEGRISALDMHFLGEPSVIWVATNITARKKLENQLFEHAHTDTLTGLNNRRSFMQSLATAYDAFRRYNQNTCVITFDLDKFKKINDALGHPGGDAALRVVADVLRAHCRTSDFCARLGGDEFVVLCPHISMEEAYTFAERIRQSCFEALEPYSAPDHRAALSIGINCFSAQDTSPDACMLRADKGIYYSKSRGGNQTCVTSEPI